MAARPQQRVFNQAGGIGMASVIGFEYFSQEIARSAGDSGHGSEVRTARDGVHTERLVEFRRRIDGDRSRSLSRLIESEIIPRLLVAHTTPVHALPAAIGDGDTAIRPAEVAAFVPLTLQVEADELLGYVEGLAARGVPLETMLVDLIAPAARRLGEEWDADRCDFVDVTMGLWRLQMVVRELSSRAPHAYCAWPAARRALFASLEGDRHSFGTVVIDEVFSAQGWHSERLDGASTAELCARVREDRFDLAGLTITRDCHIAPLPAVVRAIRAASANPRIRVMVGGRVFTEDAGLAYAVGADGTAPDARVAVRVADELIDALAQDMVTPMMG